MLRNVSESLVYLLLCNGLGKLPEKTQVSLAFLEFFLLEIELNTYSQNDDNELHPTLKLYRFCRFAHCVYVFFSFFFYIKFIIYENSFKMFIYKK